MYEIIVPFPKAIPKGIAFLDLETRKVPTDDFIMSNGEHLRRRWSAFAAGIATGAAVTLIATYDEERLLSNIADIIGHRTVRYSATRQFDEMIMKGRFTNARRAHESEPFYPAMPGADNINWINIFYTISKSGMTRARDVDSKMVPQKWEMGARILVMVHLLRDVCEMMFCSHDTPPDTKDWCKSVLISNNYASSLICT